MQPAHWQNAKFRFRHCTRLPNVRQILARAPPQAFHAPNLGLGIARFEQSIGCRLLLGYCRILFSFHLKQPACNLIDGILQLRGFVRRPMFAAADVLPINKIAFEAEGFLYGQECEAENISFGRENLFQQYKVRRILERGARARQRSASSPASLQ